MKYLKMLGLAALSAMALMAFVAGPASATTLELGGVTQNKSVSLEATIKSGTSAVLRDTSGFSVNTCTSSEVAGSTETTFTGPTVTGKVSKLTFSNCTDPVTVHKNGTLHVAYSSGTNGTVSSSGAEVTVDGPFGYITCTTGAGTTLGTLTGVSSGNATMDVNAVLNCTVISTARWTGTYTVTSPAGLGVSA
jgi:hypothetical protein